MRLPQELIDAIIKNCRENGWDIRNFALVCHQWLHPSRRHLFRHVRLDPPCGRYHRRPTDVPYTKRLYSVLLKSPHLVEYIKEVKVYEGQKMRKQDWVSTDETLPLVLRMLVKLEKFQFHRLNWEDFSEDLQQSICFVLELPTLSTLEIDQGLLDGSFLCHAKYLTHLSLTEYVTWSEKTVVEATTQANTPCRPAITDLPLARIYKLASWAWVAIYCIPDRYA